MLEGNQIEVLINETGYGGRLREFGFEPVFAPFFRRAETSPEVVAIVQGPRQLTYGELAQRARDIAAHLLEQGLVAPQRVGIYLDRSIEATAAMLGVLRAGLVYVPLDTRNPRERLEHMVKTSSIGTVLTSSCHVEAVKALGAEPLVVEEINASDDVQLPDIAPEDEAYVIYTSGTTGKPKGVIGGHLQFSRQMHGWNQLGYGNGPIRTALIASYGFDSSFLEHFLSLNNGGCLVVFEKEDIMDTESLANLIYLHGIEFAILSPALLGGVVGCFEESGRSLPLKYLVSGGEPVPNDSLARFHRLKPTLDIRVGYGTTEATIAVTTHSFNPNKAGSGHSPIGRPLPGYYIFLLDDNGRLVTPGETGQICISGDVLARGYDSNEEETRQRFVTNPFRDAIINADCHEQMYLTGDLAYYNEDSDLVFQGRLDNQVQVRGLRIELGEVEAAVKRAFGGGVFCMAHEHAGEKGIVAYIAGADSDLISTRLERLAEMLPEYMLPTWLVPVEVLPVNVNDKVDKAKLLPPGNEHLIARYRDIRGDEAPATLIEERILALAAALLNIEGHISAIDRFVDLGADSLRIVKLVIDAQKTFSVKLPIKKMNAKTLSARELATFVEAAKMDVNCAVTE